jgi:hypothetical protein
MLSYLKRSFLRNLVSPTTLALLACSLFAFGWLFPPGLYSSYLREPDWLFLNPVCFLYYSLCLGGFFLGVYFSRYIEGASFRGAPPRISAVSAFSYLGAPVITMTALCGIYLVLLGTRIDFVALLASQQGSSLKVIDEHGAGVANRWEMVHVFLTATLGWAQYRALQLRLPKDSKKMFWIIFAAGWLVDAATSIALVDRTRLMPLIANTMMIAIFFRTRGKRISLFRIAGFALVAMLALVGTFLMISFLRGSLVLNALVESLLGYTIVSYNRMAALLLGAMHYNYEGKGVYMVPFLSGSEGLNKLIPFNDMFGWPTARELWRSEFASVAQSGLNPGYIWSSMFGYLYSDIGWLTPIYMFFYSLFICYFWIKFKTGKAIGLVVYPWAAFGIMFWVGVNFMPYDRLLNYIEVGLLLTWYDQYQMRVIRDPENVVVLATQPVILEA